MHEKTGRNIKNPVLNSLVYGLMGILAAVCTADAQPVEGMQQIPENGIITRPGYYLMQKDMSVNRDYGIKIEADGVTLDLGGHALRYTDEPRPGIFGVVCSDRRDVRITNGTIGGFWFGFHCTQNRELAIDHVRCDDIPYLAVNVAQSHRVTIRDCEFTNFRYDIPKDKDTYVIGINIGAEDALISGNIFKADYTADDPHEVGMETVFVLFSANVSQHCVVTHNEMSANVVLPRSYGIWVASNANITASYNKIDNMKYGLCLASEASTVANYNHFTAAQPPAGSEPIETIGVSAGAPKDVFVIKNKFEGLSVNALLPEGVEVIE